METNIDELQDDELQDAGDDLEIDGADDASETDGDCNESQPCRGDEPWLPQDIE